MLRSTPKHLEAVRDQIILRSEQVKLTYSFTSNKEETLDRIENKLNDYIEKFSSLAQHYAQLLER